MTHYRVLVAAELLPEFTNDNPLLPAGLMVLEVSAPQPRALGGNWHLVSVEDDKAPEWCEGRIVDLDVTYHYSNGKPVRASVHRYHEVTDL